MNFQKFSNIVGSIPLVGPLTKVISAPIIASQGAREDSEYIRRFDVADLNPIKNIGDLTRHIIGATKDYDEGIWLGKRPLAGQHFGMSIVPGVDLYHYAIMINGWLYHVQSDDQGVTFRVDIECSESMIRTFTWYPTDFTKCYKSRDDLTSFAERFENEKSYKLIPKNNNEANCQSFVRDMFAYAANIKMDKASNLMKVYLGTLLY